MKVLLLILALCAAPAQAKHRPRSAPVPHRAPPSVLLYDVTQHRALVYRNPEQQRPLASITKLMTAMISLDSEHNLNRSVRFHGQDMPLSTVYTFLLIRSDNQAAEFLAQNYRGGRDQFLADMNRRARDWGMSQTRFDDPTGRSALNISTVGDINIMVQHAADYKLITDVSPLPQKNISMKVRHRRKISVEEITLRNTNFRLLFEFDHAILSKTGFTNAAGRCLAMMVEKNGRRYSVIVLGTDSVEQRARTVEDLVYNYTGS